MENRCRSWWHAIPHGGPVVWHLSGWWWSTVNGRSSARRRPHHDSGWWCPRTSVIASCYAARRVGEGRDGIIWHPERMVFEFYMNILFNSFNRPIVRGLKTWKRQIQPRECTTNDIWNLPGIFKPKTCTWFSHQKNTMGCSMIFTAVNHPLQQGPKSFGLQSLQRFVAEGVGPLQNGHSEYSSPKQGFGPT